MNKILSFVVVLATATFISCQPHRSAAAAETALSLAASNRSHKESVFTPEELIAAGAHLVNHPIKVSGIITDVCKRGGKKCTLSGHQSKSNIQVMADGSIEQFTNDMVGTEVQVKGIVRERRVTKEMIADEELVLQECFHSAAVDHEMKHHCRVSMEDLDEMKVWMTRHHTDFYPVYYVTANSYVVIN